MLERTKLKDFLNAGHKEDQSENEAREEKRPSTTEVAFSW
jgi:hypothetical protein